jgi:DNA repair protein RecO (recombination protein O)
MSSHFRTQGIVLQKQDRGEADRVFIVFTKDFGKLQLRAVSERKITSKLRSGLELFFFSEIAFIQGKAYKTITDVALQERYRELRADIMSMRVVYRLAEIADEILKDQERDENIWNLFQETLVFFNRSNLSTKERNLAAYYFLWNLLTYIGYGPSLSYIAKKDEYIAQTIQMFLEQDVAVLQSFSIEGIQEELLKEISREHLLKVLEN